MLTLRAVRLFANSTATLVVPCDFLFSNAEYATDKADPKLRWAMIAPYGDWPNQEGLQRIQKPDAITIVNEFERVSQTANRLVGLPWYIGHPDHPAFANRYKDGKAYGRIKKLEARDDGLYAGIKFAESGEKLLADEAFHGHSVNWFLREDPKQKGVWRPFKLKSVGFTNEPNIPVPTVTTANEQRTLFKRLASIRLFGNGGAAQDEHASLTEAAKSASLKAHSASMDANTGTGSHEKARDKHLAAAGKLKDLSNVAQKMGRTEEAWTHMDAARQHDSKAREHHSKAFPGAVGLVNEKIDEAEADKPMKNARRRIANVRHKNLMNSFGPWQNFEACLTKMQDKYDPEAAKKVCGRLQADLGEKK